MNLNNLAKLKVKKKFKEDFERALKRLDDALDKKPASF